MLLELGVLAELHVGLPHRFSLKGDFLVWTPLFLLPSTAPNPEKQYAQTHAESPSNERIWPKLQPAGNRDLEAPSA